ncbi:CUT1 ABC transporter substrate-binding lipoprotein [Pontimonas salivibrio]|uniref:CUT1 ABC transporter substrate-binding lipoprotein n=2 Tax=Pontimonas salivibrio TaxID=1159327 RepID=A0A2L2BP69_9MICO|nr:CUT1 ABC transporter substrate-binding lipoprotein [Pontimonas salivibrio]
MHSKRMSALSLAALSALTLSACATGGGSDAGGQAGDSGESSASSSELVMWHMESVPHRVEAWEALADEYNATDPAIPVSVQVQEWDSVYQGVAAAAQSGAQPDILFAIPDFATYVRNLGLGQPVTETVNEIDSQYGLIPAATASYTDDGDVWAVPMYGMVQLLWYNKPMLEEAGLEAPETWSELLAAAEALTTDDRAGIAVPAGRNLASDQVAYSFMLTGGAGNWFGDDGTVAFDRAEVTESIDFYNQLLQFSPEDSANYAWGEPQAALNSGSAAMAVEKGQYLAPWTAESGLQPEDLGCAPIPVKDDGGSAGSIYYSNGAMVLAEDADRQAASADFLKWLMEPDVYGRFLDAEPGLFLPVTSDSSQTEAWRSGEIINTYSECVDVMLEQADSGGLFGFVDGQYIDRIGDISGQNILAQTIQRVYVNGETPAEAVAWAQSAMEEAIG